MPPYYQETVSEYLTGESRALSWNEYLTDLRSVEDIDARIRRAEFSGKMSNARSLHRERADLYSRSVFDPSMNGDTHLMLPSSKADLICDAQQIPDRRTGPENILFFRNNRHNAIIAFKADQMVGVYQHVPTVFNPMNPDRHRRRGVGARLVAEHDIAFRKDDATQFTEAGFRGRLAAHALHVTWAILDGKTDIPQEVLDEYRVYDGKLRLAERIDDPSLYQPASTIRNLYPSAAQAPVVPVPGDEPDEDEDPSP